MIPGIGTDTHSLAAPYKGEVLNVGGLVLAAEQMVIIARRSTQDLKPSNDPAFLLMPAGEAKSLTFSLGDILDKVTALKDDWDYTEQPEATAPEAGSDGQQQTTKPDCTWKRAYSGLEGPLCDAVLMVQIAADLVFEGDGHDDEDHRAQTIFSAMHGRQLLEGVRRRYYEQWTPTGDVAGV